jgi:16S rRNA (guanine527-N7)-methyltransferase
MIYISDAEIKQALKPYGFAPNSAKIEAIRSYISLLLQWNQRISLTAVTQIPEILRFHFGESIFPLSWVPIDYGRLADVGSGAGFPGIALKIGSPALELTLIESNAKKSALLSEVIRALKLDRAVSFHGRMADLPANSAPFDFITARAVGRHDELLKWAQAHLSSSGKLVLWLGDEDVRAISKLPSWIWRSARRIPASQRRFILTGSPRT